MEQDAAILNLSNVTIGYPGHAPVQSGLHATGLRHELIALIGENGVGKSTLLKTITGLHKPVEGELLIMGKNIMAYTRNERAEKISYVSTEPVYGAHLKVSEVVILGRYPHTGWTGRLTAQDKQSVQEALAMTEMTDFSDRYIDEMSDGEKQRAMIARSLAQDTPLIILDEPAAFMDVPHKFDTIQLLKRLTREKGKTIVFSTHDLNIAIREADKLWMMLPGKITEGAPEDLILNGAFETLFPCSKIHFDREKGEYTLPKQSGKRLLLRGEGLVLQLTMNALQRNGFETECNLQGDENVIINKNGEKYNWTIQQNNNRIVCRTLYELCRKISLEFRV